MAGTPNLLSSGFHFQVALGQHLWNDLFSAALPVQVGGGKFDVTSHADQVVKMLEDQVGGQVKLLSDKTEGRLPKSVEDLKGRYAPKLRQQLRLSRDKAVSRLQENVKFDGDWTLHVTQEGTKFSYAPDGLGVSAQIKAVADGRVALILPQGTREIPFKLERMVRGSFELKHIAFDRTKGSLMGTIRNLHLELGQSPVIKFAERWIDKALAAKLGAFNPLPMLKVAQINESLSSALGNLQMAASIDDVAVEITESQLVMKVNFLFKRG